MSRERRFFRTVSMTRDAELYRPTDRRAAKYVEWSETNRCFRASERCNKPTL